MESIVRDALFALRSLARNPGFAGVVLSVLALGTGGTTAVFFAVDNAFFRPLPFADADRLVRLHEVRLTPDGERETNNIGDREFATLRDDASSLSGVAGFQGYSATLLDGELPERVSRVGVTPGALAVLGVAPVLGRGFAPEEERVGRSSGAALISSSLWERAFSRDPNVVGRTLVLDDGVCTVVGVLPAGFKFPYEADLWVPDSLDLSGRGRHSMAVFGRLAPGRSGEDASSETAVLARRLADAYPETNAGVGFEIVSMRESLVDGEGRVPLAALALVGFFLLLASANVANLLLARAVARRKEIAIRAALGATRARQIRGMLVESTVISALGGAIGLALAFWASEYLPSLVPRVLADELSLGVARLDARVFLFALACSAAAGLLSGLAPALLLSRPDLRSSLDDGSRTSGVGTGHARALDGLVVCEVALSLVLVAGAGLLVEKFVALRSADLGFDGAKVLTLVVTPSDAQYPPGPSRAELVRRIVERVGAAPGVTGVGATTVNPLWGGTWSTSVVVDGLAPAPDGASFQVNHRLVTPGLLRAMGIPLLRGRGFTDADTEGAEPVVIVSARMARRYWGDGDPLGRRVRWGTAATPSPWLTVVGVVGDVRDSGDADDTWYLPYDQRAASSAAETVHLMVRGEGDPRGLAPAVRAAVRDVAPGLAVYEVAAMDDVYSTAIAQDRMAAILLGLVATFGLILSALGVYGVMSFAVLRQTREIGIRLALGAAPSEIIASVVRRGLALTLGGAVLGLCAAGALGLWLAWLFASGSGPSSVVYGGACLLVVGTALAACYLPARRASRTDPLLLLRRE